jgi:hypothetical protein
MAASSYTPEVQQPDPGETVSKSEVTLDKLIEVAGPFIQSYFESQERVHQRDLECEATLLEHHSRRQRNVVWAVGTIIGIVLAFAAYLIAQGRDSVALDVIKLVASLGSVGFGGYGIAMARRRPDKRDE